MTTHTYNSTDVPQSWNLGYATSTLVVPDSFTITDLRLSLCGGPQNDCEWLSLQHPDGSIAAVFAGASYPWACGELPVTTCSMYGTGGLQACLVSPSETNVLLTDIIGKNAAGTWTLYIGDSGGYDCYSEGTLTAWSLEIDDAETPVSTLCFTPNTQCIEVIDAQTACIAPLANSVCMQIGESR